MGSNKGRVLVQSISISIDSLTDLFSRAESTLTAAILLLFVLRVAEIANGYSVILTHLGEKVVRDLIVSLFSFYSAHLNMIRDLLLNFR